MEKQKALKAIYATAAFIALLLFGQMYHLAAEWLEVNKLQSPVVFQKPWTDRYITPVGKPKVTLIRPTVAPKVIIKPKVTPTPAPKKRALKIDLVRDVEAAEMVYGYESVNLDAGQRAIADIVEARLGKAGAQLVFKESGFHNLSVNSSSGACGLFQAYPCEKMGCSLEDIDCQLNWGSDYIVRRYGTPEKALSFHLANGWY